MRFLLTFWLAAVIALGASTALGHGEEKDPGSVDELIKGASAANGQRIFIQGVNRLGEPIPFREGPPWLFMHGGSCVTCHGPQGQGGIVPHLCSVQTPAVNYRALTGAHHHHGRGEEEEQPYTPATLKRAITQGLQPNGKALDWCMPRWSLTDEEFTDLLAFLVSLDE